MKGIIGKKVGMTQIFDTDGTVIPVTVIEAGPCYVTQVRNLERDGYTAIQMGFDELMARQDGDGDSRLKKPQQGHLRREALKAADIPDVRVLREFRIKNGQSVELEEGSKITVGDMFAEGDVVDVVGTSKGRGFAGTVKRHGFNRQPKTHGQSDRERAPGSIGASATPSRVRKGMRMGGRMGNERVTVQNLQVVVVDSDRNLLAVKGSVPGARGGIVVIHEAVKKN